MSYNGWSNRETWLISIWYNPETLEDIQLCSISLLEQYDALPDGPLKDMIDIQAINWQELEDAMEEYEGNWQ